MAKPLDIAKRLMGQDVTPKRLQKLQRACQRSNVSVRDVLDAVPVEKQAAVKELAEKHL